jgi:hypothetical protein
MNNGSLTLNGITDAQLDTIILVKEQHEGAIDFNPQQLQPIGSTPPRFPGRPGFPDQPFLGQPIPPQSPPGTQSMYNNAVLCWHADDGLAVILELIHRLYPNGPVPPFPAFA